MIWNVLVTSSHLGLEHLEHVVEVAWASDFAQHIVELRLGHQLADVVESGAEIVLGDGTILQKFKYSHRIKTGHSRTGNIWKPDFIVSGFQILSLSHSAIQIPVQ